MRRSISIERSIFLSAYAMRRLDDAKKLSTSWRGSTIKCKRYEALGAKPSLLDWHHIDRFYDLSKPIPCTMSARNFCDLVIHSYVFMECLHDDRSVEGFFITSDKKSQALWLFTLDAVTSLMERTAGDDPSTVIMIRNDDTGQMDVVWAGDGRSSGWRKNPRAGSLKPPPGL